MIPLGRKEVGEAVIIAALTSLFTGLIQLGVDVLRKRAGLDKESDEQRA